MWRLWRCINVTLQLALRTCLVSLTLLAPRMLKWLLNSTKICAALLETLLSFSVFGTCRHRTNTNQSRRFLLFIQKFRKFKSFHFFGLLRRREVVRNRRFGTTYQCHLEGSRSFLGHLNPWSCDRQVIPKRRFWTTSRRIITQKTKEFNSTAADVNLSRSCWHVRREMKVFAFTNIGGVCVRADPRSELNILKSIMRRRLQMHQSV
jgi:hypothetical protein